MKNRFIYENDFQKLLNLFVQSGQSLGLFFY